MAYRDDAGLNFLGTLSSKELNDLVNILIYDKDGDARFTEGLTISDNYKKYKPNHKMYWKEIAEEIQLFGGNTIVNLLFRFNKGVEYKEILCDVCDKLKVNYSKYAPIDMIENCLLQKILYDALKNMTPDQIKELGVELGIDNFNNLNAQALIGVFQAIFQAGGFASYKLTLIIVNATMKALTGKGLQLATNATITKTMSILTGPIGWAITGIWTAIDIASPAYRVTIPAVIQVAYLRKLSQNRDAIKQLENLNL
ncbi:DUF3944 domain-containing protein [Wielerella bovis]|uniref:DUF3944 domain-containing protein n=1 Tax=Wielerella bovis TaxID=2917790 RepID=UPI002018CCA5|nr:DUF3944 domain-containing protein [Wielerella bovis]ULJ61824.1 DUF3944 domain-containing protein [Wielerella bovis]